MVFHIPERIALWTLEDECVRSKYYGKVDVGGTVTLEAPMVSPSYFVYLNFSLITDFVFHLCRLFVSLLQIQSDVHRLPFFCVMFPK